MGVLIGRKIKTCNLQRHLIVRGYWYEPYPHDVKNLNGCLSWGTLMFSSIGANGENFLIVFNSAEKEDMAV